MIINVQLAADGISQQVKISLHQFNNCLGQVKLDITTPYSRCLANFIFQQDSAQVHKARGTIHLVAGNFAKCI